MIIPEFTQDLITEYITTSRMVTHRPCYLFNSLVTPHSFSVDAMARLRNGEMITSEIVLSLKLQYEQDNHPYLPPVYFNRGLYVELVGEILKVLDDCGDTSNIEDWVEIMDGLNPVDETTFVKEGSHSMALGIDADLSAADAAGWLNSQFQGDLFVYQHDWIYIWIYLSTVDYLAVAGPVLIYYIGTNGGNRIYFTFIKSDLIVGWNLLKCDLDNPDGEDGVIDWTNINYHRFFWYELIGNVDDFTVYVDSIMFVRPFSGATDGITEGVTVQYLIE